MEKENSLYLHECFKIHRIRFSLWPRCLKFAWKIHILKVWCIQEFPKKYVLNGKLRDLHVKECCYHNWRTAWHRKFVLIHHFCNIIKANYGIYISKLCLNLVFLLGSFVHYQRLPSYGANLVVMCGQLHKFVCFRSNWDWKSIDLEISISLLQYVMWTKGAY